MTRRHERPGWIKRFVRWLFGSPFQELPPEFGDPVPADLRLFEAQAEEMERRPTGKVPPPPPVHEEKSKPARQDEFLERE